MRILSIVKDRFYCVSGEFPSNAKLRSRKLFFICLLLYYNYWDSFLHVLFFSVRAFKNVFPFSIVSDKQIV